MNRRTFLSRTALASLGFMLAPKVLEAAEAVDPRWTLMEDLHFDVPNFLYVKGPGDLHLQMEGEAPVVLVGSHPDAGGRIIPYPIEAVYRAHTTIPDIRLFHTTGHWPKKLIP